ncbi:probable RNA methyltransferase At5g51130 isoform X2 [Aristolochia californica]|uniref:probable RNA methyltransferase At5g51130 isoform X2 n=1 Tax=Aristolochia californica TaxID=171875 RepID=UPI0035DC716E
MAQEDQNQQATKKRKRKPVYIYGNYKAYYNYRIDQSVGEDPRLAVLKKEWFEGKNCLDIGCNQGLMTISIAKKFSCERIVGVDIDGIETAQWNLRRVAKKEQSEFVKTSEKECGSDEKVSESSVRNLFKGVSFRKENIVENEHACSGQYDTILCLSVTKWIHLNWGDDGLITLFVKIWNLLRPGGTLVLEPQPWSSYKKNRLVSEVASMNFKKISLMPSCFHEILLDKVGFRAWENISTNVKGSIAGFNRPIFAFYK